MDFHSSDYLIAINAAFEAGNEVMAIYATDFDTDLKEDGSPITQADRAANEIIVTALAQTGIPVISEESPNESFKYRSKHDLIWLVDPIDGTREFTKRNGEFTINIALSFQGKAIFGIVTAPARNQAWVGWQKQGAWKLGNIHQVIKTLPFTGIDTFLQHCFPVNIRRAPRKPVIVLSRSHLTIKTNAMMHFLLGDEENYQIERVGSSLKYCLIAEGAADFYLRAEKINEWDTAAGQAVLEAAGGKIITWPRGGEMQYNQQELLNPGFIAFGDTLFSELLMGKLPFEERE
jgi:3'(2'), 5'-bisphosphate nucleotidase